MQDRSNYETFSLLGGPVYRFSRRLHLVRRDSNTLLAGFAIGGFLWLVLALLAAIQGVLAQIFSLSLIGGHVRLLIVIPLFFIAESVLAPRMRTFVHTIVRSDLVPARQLKALEREIDRIQRWNNAWLPEALCLLTAVAFTWLAPQLPLYGTTSNFEPAHPSGGLALAGQWYGIVCLTVFRFLLARCLWQLALWCYFLWRLARLDLQLLPTHPDGVAGMGYLEVVHTHFTPLIVALSVIQSASLAEDLVTGAATFDAVYPSFALVLFIAVVLFIGPLFIFAPRLWACRIGGLSNYMELASRYVQGFDRKWLANSTTVHEEILGTADLQSLADLGNSIAMVRNMRWVPLSLRLIKDVVLAALVPMLPLMLFQYPLNTLIQTFFARLTGL